METDFDSIKNAFKMMREEGWNPDAPLVWGHFFIHSELEPLWNLFGPLREQGYEFEQLYKNEEGDYGLQVSKVERRTAQQLHEQNEAFNAFAAEHGIDSYDGWDVGEE